MKFFLAELFGFSLLVSLVLYIGSLHYGPPLPSSDFFDAIIDKHAILDTTPSSRIIFCGGSNLAFGIDSKEIQDSIGMRVINLGLNAALGLDFILNEIKTSARPEDVVILSIEYFLGMDGDYKTKKEIANNFPKASTFYRQNLYQEINLIVENITLGLKRNLLALLEPKPIIENSKGNVYSRAAFNSFGDNVLYLDLPSYAKLADRSKMTYEYYDGIERLNELADLAAKNNFKVYWLYPNYPQSEYDVNGAIIERYAKDLSAELKMPILNSPKDFVFADSLFYDTVYHLGKAGRKKRSEMIIDILKKNHIVGVK